MLAGFYLAITVSVIRKRLTGSKTHSSSNQRRSQKGGSSRGQWFRGTLSQMITALKIPHELCPIISRLWHFFLVSQLFLFFGSKTSWRSLLTVKWPAVAPMQFKCRWVAISIFLPTASLPLLQLENATATFYDSAFRVECNRMLQWSRKL